MKDALDRLTIDKSRENRSDAGKKRFPKAILLASLIAGALIIIVLVLKNRSISIETATVSQVYPTQTFTLLNASGYVVAQRKAAVASKITGRLEWIGVEEGSRVSGGDIIARLENLDLKASINQAEAGVQNARASLEQSQAELADAERSYQRQKELLRQGIVAQADFDAAATRYRRAIAAVSGGQAGVNNSAAVLSNAKIAYDYSLIRAPFNAVVLTKNADVGDIITPLGAAANAKAAVVTIADMTSLQVEADVAESNLGQVRQGQPCEITLDALPNLRLRGAVYTIVPTADRTKASVLVKVRFIDNDRRILPEMSAKVAFLEREAKPEEEKPHLAVTPAAIVTSSGREGVFIVKGDRVIFTPVTRGVKIGDMVEVSDVKSGDKIALKPLAKLKDGSRIKLPEKK
ncbi:MAG TPA: efflux RND transporter periplasmic adaptor subunit [Desulfuromonadaceae bacterium]|jgi:RND family efflux transporter MFP subunit